jgi:hypothetical protein
MKKNTTKENAGDVAKLAPAPKPAHGWTPPLNPEGGIDWCAEAKVALGRMSVKQLDDDFIPWLIGTFHKSTRFRVED